MTDRKAGERKAVLNVTVSESLAAAVREAAAESESTISSVVERALAEHLAWERKRLDGIAAIDEYFREHGYPTPEEREAARARVDEEIRLLEEARRAMAEQRAGEASRDGGSAA
jgi:post-segregation antitoxin (ccd killing protein)